MEFVYELMPGCLRNPGIVLNAGAGKLPINHKERTKESSSSEVKATSKQYLCYVSKYAEDRKV